jgi:hypothetical protein
MPLGQTRSEHHRITIHVGQNEGDLRGHDDRILQAAIDTLARMGGGTLRIGPGTYTMRNALYVCSDIHIIGAGDDTVLLKAPSVETKVASDGDWYETQVQVEDATGFTVGGGLVLRARHHLDTEGHLGEVKLRTIVGIDGNTLLLGKRNDGSFWLDRGAVAGTHHSIIHGGDAHNITIENITFDGQRDKNHEINGNYAGAVFAQDCDRWLLRRVTSRNYNGDGFSFQRCDDWSFENCRALGNANLGFHPGSGSQRPTLHGCVGNGNDQGFFFCWGVTNGHVENCKFNDNTSYGMTIGHRDTDNHVLGCTFENNAKVGIQFRKPQTDFRGGHRNVIERCTIVDNGAAENGYGIELIGRNDDVAIIQCKFVDSGSGKQKVGIVTNDQCNNLKLDGNVFEGLAEDTRNVQDADG